jgi:two-component system cell cycle sensor histidine kinase/response regulator CckA
MDVETRRRAFEPFFSTKETGQGTGLGLSTVLGVARAHHGAVEIDSEPGAGTTVRVLLPSTPPATVATGIYPAARHPDRFTETILVAEDDVLVARSLERTLRSQGFTVITAADGEEALRLYEEHREIVNLVILDLLMPGIDGQETLACQC